MLIQLGTALVTVRDENGFIGVQHDPFAIRAEEGTAAFDELLHPFGFISRPLDPAADGKGCSLFFAGDNRESFAWLANDPRLVDRHPPLKKGGSCQYAADGQFANMDPEIHTWTLYVPYAAGKAHLVTCGVDGNGKPIIELSSGTGLAFTLLDRVGTWASANGANYLTLDDSGLSVVGPFKAAGGADLGGPASEPLSKFAVLSSALQAVATALAAIPAGLTPGGAGAAGPIAAAQAAIVAFVGGGATLTVKGA